MTICNSQIQAYVLHNDKKLYLIQQAYAKDNKTYAAYAKDGEDNDYEITWEITNFETENEDECCDWDNYTIRQL